MKDSRLLLNFGGITSPPLRYPPSSVAGGSSINSSGGFQPLAEVSEDAQVANSNCGWRLNPYDATAGVEVQPDGMALQAHWGSGWQGCRANRVSLEIRLVNFLSLEIRSIHLHSFIHLSQPCLEKKSVHF